MLLSKNDRRIDHNRQEFDAFRELVALGPKSMPFLLKALDDKSPTKLTMTHKSAFGEMWLANELSGNPVNKTEAAVLAETTKRRSDHFEDHIETYTVKVGDVCFVALGQIVGRSYSAVRYQPTACIVINSPTDDAKLCSQVRGIWASDDANKRLFESLLLDYSTCGIFNGETLDGWSVGSNFQCDAATRLLFYYPETAGLIAERLRQCDVNKAQDVDVFIKREVRSGIRAKEFIEAIRWSKDPGIVAALRDTYDRSDDSEIRKAISPTMKPAKKTKTKGKA